MISNEIFPFLVAAIALLGSPGPAIAALLAVGRVDGWAKGLKFYIGLQFGLATAAGFTALGLFAIISAFPIILLTMSLIATAYLLYLAYKIATSPVGEEPDQNSQSSTKFAGFLIGITNPKAYLAFASLFASFVLIQTNETLDSVLKWVVVIVVMILVDFIWLGIGVRIGYLKMSNQSERVLNYILAAMIVLATILALN